MLAEARESIASAGAPGVVIVRFWLGGAGSPTNGTVCLGSTLNAVLTFCGPPRSTVADTPQ